MINKEIREDRRYLFDLFYNYINRNTKFKVLPKFK